MSKLFSLLKATMSQDMNLFKIEAKGKTRFSKIAVPLILTLVVMAAVGSYAYMFAEALAPTGSTFVVLTLFTIFPAVLSFIEGLYKSQGILFDAKDNDLLFSLPISKPKILFIRIFKLMLFQLLYSILFMLPAMIVYAIFENPAPSFYLISLLVLILSPIIPTVLASLIGYLLKSFSVRFKAKKFMQVVSTSLMLLLVLYLSSNIEGLLGTMAENAGDINNAITNIYYPAKLYLNLVQNFNFLDLLILLAINILPAILLIYAASIFYFKIISKASERGSGHKKLTHKALVVASRQKSQLSALIKKELKRFFSSPVFIINAGFGLLIIAVITVGLVINFEGMSASIVENAALGISGDFLKAILPKIFFCLVVFTACMTSIPSSMVSLEGKSLNITKSLPTSPEKILLAKVLTGDLLAIPIILICDVIFFIAFSVPLLDIIFILLATFLVPTFTSLVGLIMNLKYPKMHATSDTEIVKQSMSTTVSVFIGLFVGMLSAAILLLVGQFNLDLTVALELVAFSVAVIILWQVLKKYGVKRWREINI